MKRKKQKKPVHAFVLNRRSGIYHRNPTLESCNVDQVPRRFRLYVDLPPRGAPRCQHCARR